MKLSKKESRYRAKFIAECHYNKEEQRIFDRAVSDTGKRYKELYEDMRSGSVYTFMAEISALRLSRNIRLAGMAAEEAAAIITPFANVARQATGQF